jgi:hypothetical protein
MDAPLIGTVVGLAMAACYFYKFEAMSDCPLPVVARMQRFNLADFLRTTNATKSRHISSWLPTILFALLPFGWSMLASHPCFAWAFWALAGVSGLYAMWRTIRITNAIKLLLSLFVVSGVAIGSHYSLVKQTQLDMFFVHPGAWLITGPDGKSSEWMFKATGRYTRITLYHVQMFFQDAVALRAIQAEKDEQKRLAMITSGAGTYSILYHEVDTVFFSDPIIWKPYDINNQEYNIQAYYRAGDKQYFSEENIRIINVGPRITSQDISPKGVDWRDSITVKNQVGDILMHCVDRRFPKDHTWVDGPICYPGADFSPLPRSLCSMCFGRGFEFYPSGAGL